MRCCEETRCLGWTYIAKDIEMNLQDEANFFTPFISRRDKTKGGKYFMHMYEYLCGQPLRSSEDGLRIKSTKDFPLESFGGRGGGFSSMVQTLFRANPCCSSDPRFPNFNESQLEVKNWSHRWTLIESWMKS